MYESKGVQLIAQERERQVSQEGWMPQHDDAHEFKEFVEAAIGYASRVVRPNVPKTMLPTEWPWDRSWWKPSDDPIRNLTKAGALIAAEIDRLTRKGRTIA